MFYVLTSVQQGSNDGRSNKCSSFNMSSKLKCLCFFSQQAYNKEQQRKPTQNTTYKRIPQLKANKPEQPIPKDYHHI